MLAASVLAYRAVRAWRALFLKVGRTEERTEEEGRANADLPRVREMPLRRGEKRQQGLSGR